MQTVLMLLTIQQTDSKEGSMNENNQMNPQGNAQYNPQGGQPYMGNAQYNPQGGQPYMGNAQYNPQGNPNMGGAQYSPNPAAYSAPKKPLDKGFLMFICSIAACVVGIVVFFLVANSSFGYVTVAKKFYYSLVTNHPDQAFEMLDVKESDFVNKKAFSENYGLTEDAIKAFDEKELQDVDFSVESKDSKKATVYVTSKGSSFGIYDALSIDVVKDGNAFGIFPNWKVASNGIVVKNVTFEAPAGATVEVNGKAIDKKYLDSSKSDKETDCYVIPQALNATYMVACTADGLNASPRAISIISDNDEIQLDYGEPDADTMKAVSKQAYDAVVQIVNSAKDGTDFATLVSKLNVTGDTADMQDEYNRLVSSFAADPTQTGVTSIEFTNMKAIPRFEGYDGEPKINVSVSGDLKIHHNTKSFFSDAISDSVETDRLNSGCYFVLKDGKWVMSSETNYIVPYLWVSTYSD